MKKASFENSVDVLVKAYMNGTLLHQQCAACAVGNLCADALGYEINRNKWIKDGELVFTNWDKVFMTGDHEHEQSIFPRNYQGAAMIEIDATGYSWQDLARIEYAFETADGKKYDENGWSIEDDEEWMFNGLMAVVDVLADIHGVDLSTKQNAVVRFEEIHATK